MRKLKIIMIVCFFSLLLIPMITFDWVENEVSEEDNRVLTNNPFGSNYKTDEEMDYTKGIESYINDRIGFRNQMIHGYTQLHDWLFHEMVHPTYMYGKDNYVFFQVGDNVVFGDYHIAFADMVKQIQDYCEERGVPFVFVLNPAKVSLLADKLPDGINYNNDWVALFKAELDARGINYVDNSDLLAEKSAQGEMVFNKQYNAGHWNDLGAFYGVNQVLEKMKTYNPAVHINQKEDFDITRNLQTSLMVSKFPIHEYEPYFEERCELTDKTEEYDAEVQRSPQYPYFRYVVNEQRRAEGAPKVLVFQGSYMNGMGYKFLDNSLGEYIAVHDYQNITNFNYYFNIFQPEQVVFEVAEYVFTDEYFPYEAMKNMDLNPALSLADNDNMTRLSLKESTCDIKKGSHLTTIQIKDLPQDTRYAYLTVGEETYDLIKNTNEENTWYEVTLENQKFSLDSATLVITKQ